MSDKIDKLNRICNIFSSFENNETKSPISQENSTPIGMAAKTFDLREKQEIIKENSVSNRSTRDKSTIPTVVMDLVTLPLVNVSIEDNPNNLDACKHHKSVDSKHKKFLNK